MLAADLLMVGAAVFLVTSGIATLISGIRGVPMINTGTGAQHGRAAGADRRRGLPHGTCSAAARLALGGEKRPELMRFYRSGEAVHTAEQSRALISGRRRRCHTFVDNSRNIFKVDDIETYVAIKRMLVKIENTVRTGTAVERRRWMAGWDSIPYTATVRKIWKNLSGGG